MVGLGDLNVTKQDKQSSFLRVPYELIQTFETGNWKAIITHAHLGEWRKNPSCLQPHIPTVL
jgi:hypothetical protein